MRNKKLEENLKKAKDFAVIWGKFHNMFRKNKEEDFLLTKDLVDRRYDELMDSLGVRLSRRFIVGGSIYNILSLEDLSAMSEEKRSALEKDWKDSREFLGGLLGRLERKKKRISGVSRLYFLYKRTIGRII